MIQLQVIKSYKYLNNVYTIKCLTNNRLVIDKNTLKFGLSENESSFY